MLSSADNQLLTSVGPGTPAGRLLRQHWHAVLPEVALEEKGIHEVRVLGETLVLFRTAEGELGLVEAKCAHRGTSLALGYLDSCGMRCAYHGWRYDSSGQCTDTPLEPRGSKLKDKVKIGSYPVQALGGLIFAFLGDGPAPPIPRWDLMVWPNSVRQMEGCVVNCNWLQLMENAGDLLHTLILHGDAFKDDLEREGRWHPFVFPRVAEFSGLRHPPSLDWVPFEHGLRMQLPNGRAPGHAIIFPCMSWKAGSSTRQELQIRIPIDDTHTWQISYQTFTPPSGVEAPPQASVPYTDLGALDLPFSDNILTQDILVWESQGEVADRTTEMLGASDKGVIAYRRMLRRQIKANEAGEALMNVNLEPTDCLQVGPTPGQHQTNVLSELLHGFERYYVDRHGGAVDLLRDIYDRSLTTPHVIAFMGATLDAALTESGQTQAVRLQLSSGPFECSILLLPTGVTQDDGRAVDETHAVTVRELLEWVPAVLAGSVRGLEALGTYIPPVVPPLERLKKAGQLVITRG